jgi:hypothetical protein
MSASANTLVWDGSPGHYEVYYLSATDAGSGVGLWIRYTMLAPRDPRQEPSCSLWLMAMDPREGPGRGVLARKATLPVADMQSSADPFSLRIGDAVLDDHGMRGAIEDVGWDLRWEPRLEPYEHVHPLLRRARIAKTVLVLPHADLEVAGTVSLPSGEITLSGARGGQAHLWGSKHAGRWAWLHCNDLRHDDGSPAQDSFLDAVSVIVPRFGRDVGPSTPVVGRFEGEDFQSISPRRVLTNASDFTLTGWELEAIDGRRRLQVQIDAPRDLMAGVTYHDPDGELAQCYNTEVASLRLSIHDRTGSGPSGWTQRAHLTSVGRAHFEYAQRGPVAGAPLHLS